MAARTPRRASGAASAGGPDADGRDAGGPDAGGRGGLKRRAAAAHAAVSTALGHSFSNRALLAEALTHASAATPSRPDNQRFEFLGDRVLGLLTAETLCAAHPDAPEGELAPRYNALVRRQTCAAVARAAGLGDALDMARSEALTGGRKKEALLADAMEAVMAAVYLDGGLDAARGVFARLWAPHLEALAEAETPVDAKTALQEWAQGRGAPPPRYDLLSREGPDHAPSFTVEARLEDGRRAAGVGSAKREAEQAAAAALLAAVSEKDQDP